MISQDDYRWLFRKAPIMATSIAEHGTFLDVNDAMLARLGYARSEMVGHSPEEFATPECAERIRTELRPALRRTGTLENKPVRCGSQSGEGIECVSHAVF